MQNKTIILHSSAKVIHSLAIVHRIHHQLAGYGIAIKHMSHSFICHAMIYPGIAIKKHTGTKYCMFSLLLFK